MQTLVISPAEYGNDQILERQELRELERNFKSFIQNHLDDREPADYDLIWQWQKFLFDKSRQASPSERT